MKLALPLIRNIHVNNCVNCKHYKAFRYGNFGSYGQCTIYGIKDIESGKIHYDFAHSCRSDETKCGIDGIYFEEQKNIALKIASRVNYQAIFLFPFIILVGAPIMLMLS